MGGKKRGRKAPPWRATPSAPLDHAVPERRSRPTLPTAVAEVGPDGGRVAPSGRALHQHFLAVFLALFFFLAVFFLAAFRFFAIERYLLSVRNPTCAPHALSKKIFAQERRRPPSNDRLRGRNALFRRRMKGSRCVTAPFARRLNEVPHE